MIQNMNWSGNVKFDINYHFFCYLINSDYKNFLKAIVNLFLSNTRVSEKAKFITGAVITIDGGRILL